MQPSPPPPNTAANAGLLARRLAILGALTDALAEMRALIVYLRAAALAGGRCEVMSVPGAGTTVRVGVPVA